MATRRIDGESDLRIRIPRTSHPNPEGVRDELRAEQITISEGASIPGVLVQDAKTARSQADLIKEHTLGTWGPFTSFPQMTHAAASSSMVLP